MHDVAPVGSALHKPKLFPVGLVLLLCGCTQVAVLPDVPSQQRRITTGVTPAFEASTQTLALVEPHWEPLTVWLVQEVLVLVLLRTHEVRANKHNKKKAIEKFFIDYKQ